MKIALIYPNKRSKENQPHLGLAYLASFILSKNNGIEVKVLDTLIANKKETNSFFSDNYDVVGMTVTSRTYTEAVQLAKSFRETNRDVLIVFGGPHVSIMRQEIMREPLIDLAIYGEGELTFNELINILKKNNNKLQTEVLAKIKGLIYRSNSQVVVNPPRELIDNLDVIPFPALHLFPMRRYPGKLPLITSRGCPFACVFCASSQIWERKWRARSPENIIEEIIYLENKFGPRPFEFHDDGFNMSLKRVNTICDQIIDAKINLPWGVRGFRIDMVNEAVAKKMRQAGCSHVAIGIESANDEMLARMGKKISVDQIHRGIKVLRSFGIDVIGQFMIGNPGETLKTVRESLAFAKRSVLTKSTFGTAVPFPGTALWKYVEQNGKFLVDPDVTRFEEMDPRVIFETPEFTAEQRLQAIKLVSKAGMYGAITKRESFLRKIYKKILSTYIPRFLPRRAVFRLYFFLRTLRSKLSLKW